MLCATALSRTSARSVGCATTSPAMARHTRVDDVCKASHLKDQQEANVDHERRSASATRPAPISCNARRLRHVRSVPPRTDLDTPRAARSKTQSTKWRWEAEPAARLLSQCAIAFCDPAVARRCSARRSCSERARRRQVRDGRCDTGPRHADESASHRRRLASRCRTLQRHREAGARIRVRQETGQAPV